MPDNVVNWSKVKSDLGTIAPLIAGTLGTPVAGVAVKALCDVFGLAGDSATPDNIAAAIAGATPQQLNDLRLADMNHAEVMRQMGYTHEISLRQADSADLAAVNATMTAEAQNSASESWYQKSWRPANGFVVALGSLLAVIAVCMMGYEAISTKDVASLNVVPVLAGSIALILGVPGAAVGITAWHRGKMQIEQVKAGAQQ